MIPPWELWRIVELMAVPQIPVKWNWFFADIGGREAMQWIPDTRQKTRQGG